LSIDCISNVIILLLIDGYGDSLGQYLLSKNADGEARNNAGKATWEGI